MNETPSDENELNELSEDDLAIIQAFDNVKGWPTGPLNTLTTKSTDSFSESHDEETLTIFIAEADEDITKMRKTLHQLEQDEQINLNRFEVFRRAGHKLHGTAAAVNFPVMSIIASHIETIADQVKNTIIFPLIGVNALSQAVSALEFILQNIKTHGQTPEDEEVVAELETLYKNSNINLYQSISDGSKIAQPGKQTSVTQPLPKLEDEIDSILRSNPSQHEHFSKNPVIRVEARRFENLELHTEQLVEKRAHLENAQAQVKLALQDLQLAQTRLQQLEQRLSIFTSNNLPISTQYQSSSSLVMRILHESPHNYAHNRLYKSRSSVREASNQPDELDIERYTEKDLLISSLREAIADVTITTTRANTSYLHLQMVQQEYLENASLVRKDTLLLRLVPLSSLLPRLQRVIDMHAQAQAQEIQFTASGEGIEIDQNILETLSLPLLQLVRTCIADIDQIQEETDGLQRVWLHAQSRGNEITLEIGFSMPVNGGAIDAIYASIQNMSGVISTQRNTHGGISFFLRLPRTHSTVRCLRVRIGPQQLIVPFSQVHHIGERNREALNVLYHLNKLLGFPDAPHTETRIQPILIMTANDTSSVIGIAVDEVIEELELGVKPITPYLQRPGIVGTAIDGKGSVLLLIDLPELVKHYTYYKQSTYRATSDPTDKTAQTASQINILVADDSVYLRHSLRQILQRANFTVTEARDGMQAVEQLQTTMPRLCLLDVEMPYLNGFDILSLIRAYPELASVKLVILTSRSSNYHRQRAFELGAHAYLTKPCPQELLLETIHSLLAR